MLTGISRRHEGGPSSFATDKQPPVLVLGDAAGDAFFASFVKSFRQASAHSVVTATSMRIEESLKSAKYQAAARAWSRMETEYATACLGMIASTKSTISAACQIIKGGWQDGNLPGAVAFLDYSTFVQDTVLDLLGDRTYGAKHVCKSSHFPNSSWPSTMILLPADNPALAECATACRSLRSLGVSIGLEIVGVSRASSLMKSGDGIVELVDELEAFFSSSLVPYFPKRL